MAYEDQWVPKKQLGEYLENLRSRSDPVFPKVGHLIDAKTITPKQNALVQKCGEWDFVSHTPTADTHGVQLLKEIEALFIIEQRSSTRQRQREVVTSFGKWILAGGLYALWRFHRETVLARLVDIGQLNNSSPLILMGVDALMCFIAVVVPTLIVPSRNWKRAYILFSLLEVLLNFLPSAFSAPLSAVVGVIPALLVCAYLRPGTAVAASAMPKARR